MENQNDSNMVWDFSVCGSENRVEQANSSSHNNKQIAQNSVNAWTCPQCTSILNWKRMNTLTQWSCLFICFSAAGTKLSPWVYCTIGNGTHRFEHRWTTSTYWGLHIHNSVCLTLIWDEFFWSHNAQDSIWELWVSVSSLHTVLPWRRNDIIDNSWNYHSDNT